MAVDVKYGDSKKRDFKDIGAIKHEIRDPEIEEELCGSVSQKGWIFTGLQMSIRMDEVCIFNKNGKLVQFFKVPSASRVTDIVELSDGNIAVSYI